MSWATQTGLHGYAYMGLSRYDTLELSKTYRSREAIDYWGDSFVDQATFGGLTQPEMVLQKTNLANSQETLTSMGPVSAFKMVVGSQPKLWFSTV